MSDEDLRKSRRKLKAGLHLLESPFPVPIQSITGIEADDSRWYYYFGTLQDDHVAVSRLGDITFLYRLGFFGKGALSRSKPQFETHNDVTSDHARKQFMQKFREVDTDRQELQEQAYRNIQLERLRQHSAWSHMKKEKVLSEDPSTTTTTANRDNTVLDEKKPLQCTDLHAHFDEDDQMHSTGNENDDVVETKMRVSNSTSSQNALKRSASQECLNTQSCSKHLKLDDPYKLYECLRLTFEEAFFLSYGLGCLGVKENADSADSLSILGMWNIFRSRKKQFIYHYIAYHHFRSKGWVVRYGNLYGADFALYKDGMPFYHASYSVYVHLVDEDTLTKTKLTWKQISCMSRVNEKVAKEVLICYVVRPKDMTIDELTSPSCIKRFHVAEMVLRRWVPEKHRELKT